MLQIVVIEDDDRIRYPLVQALKKIDYTVHQANNGEEGLALVQTVQPDLVILDILLPKMDGWAVCKAIRVNSVVPILMLTALDAEFDQIKGLEMGADEYITKPFSTPLLLARINAMLRRVELDTTQIPANSVIEIEDVKINIEKRMVYKKNELLNLRFKEFELLSLLMIYAGKTVSRPEIFEKVWGTEWIGDMRTLDVHISWLRKKLGDNPSKPHYIQTERNNGYRFVTGK